MTLTAATRTARYAELARPSGAFAMLALDQRVTLTNLFRAAGLPSDDDQLDSFRAAAVEALTPVASAVLLERGFLTRHGETVRRAERCALIVAADRLVQPDGEAAVGSHLDDDAADIAERLGAKALKLLVVWRAGEANADNLALARDFRELAHARGMLAIVEGIVRASDGPVAATDLLRAAESLSAESDLYKAQVPIHDGYELSNVERLSRALTAACATPWVVLSAGVPAEQFPGLLAASCRGGASGFLAGRAIWGAALGSRDPADDRMADAAQRLGALRAIADREARSWPDATETRSRDGTGDRRDDA